MSGLRNNWITAVAVVNGAFLAFMAVGIGVADESTSAERFFGIAVMGVAAIAFIGGLWGVRSGRLSKPVAPTGIVLGAAGTLLWFWMVIPPIIALVVLWFGVIREGLAREAGIAAVT